jgi:hypothetical protein
MDIRWNAVLTGFFTALVLGLLIALFVPAADMGWLAYALPGLLGGFVAGYMVMGVGSGAVHGGLATVVGALALLVAWSVFAVFFEGLFPAFVGLTVGILILAIVAVPGAITGALGGWMHTRRMADRERTGAQPR